MCHEVRKIKKDRHFMFNFFQDSFFLSTPQRKRKKISIGDGVAS